MASKRRKRRRTCERKIKYVDEDEALRARHAVSKKQWRGHMNVYRCQFCNGYHIGRAKRR